MISKGENLLKEECETKAIGTVLSGISKWRLETHRQNCCGLLSCSLPQDT